MLKKYTLTILLSLNVLATHYLFVPNDPDNQNRFWDSVEQVFTSYTKQFGMESKVFMTKSNRFSYRNKLIEVLKTAKAGDYFYILYMRNSFSDIVIDAISRDVNVVVFNTLVPRDQISKIMKLSKFKSNFFYSSLDDVYAGKILMEGLVNKINKDKVRVVILKGASSSTASQLRYKGALQARTDKVYEVVQSSRADWSRQKARDMAKKFHSRHKEIDAYWCASDSMARGVYDYYKDKSNIPFIGGVDWSSDAIEMISTTPKVLSVGGHFLEIAFVLDMIRNNPKTNRLKLPLKFSLLDSSNLKSISKKLELDYWKNFDYKNIHSFKFK